MCPLWELVYWNSASVTVGAVSRKPFRSQSNQVLHFLGIHLMRLRTKKLSWSNNKTGLNVSTLRVCLLKWPTTTRLFGLKTSISDNALLRLICILHYTWLLLVRCICSTWREVSPFHHTLLYCLDSFALLYAISSYRFRFQGCVNSCTAAADL